MSLDRQTDTTVRGVYWGVVINNPTEADMDAVHKGPFPPWVRHIKGQEENAPTTGTHHLNFYLNTEQVRLKCISDWLKRASIKPLMGHTHKNYWLDVYSQKPESAIEGTQWEVDLRKVESERKVRTMAGILTSMAEFRWSSEVLNQKTWLDEEKTKSRPLKQVYEEEYWDIVSIMCGQDENLIQLFTMPAYKTAWVNTRRTWVQKSIVDRQTRMTIVAPDGVESPVSV